MIHRFQYNNSININNNVAVVIHTIAIVNYHCQLPLNLVANGMSCPYEYLRKQARTWDMAGTCPQNDCERFHIDAPLPKLFEDIYPVSLDLEEIT